MINFLRFFIILLFIPVRVFSATAPVGYVPTASVSASGNATIIKTAFTPIGQASADLFSRVYPAVANSATALSSSVGAMASSAYNGSAAIASKMYVPLSNGVKLGINMVGNIPKAELAATALAIAKNPYLGVGVVVGTGLYDYYKNASLSKDENGNLMTNPALLPAGSSGNCNNTSGTSYAPTSANRYPPYYILTTSITVTVKSERDTTACYNSIPPNASTLGSSFCGTYIWNEPSQLQCYYAVYEPFPTTLPPSSPATDAHALKSLTNTPAPNPANVLKDMVSNGSTPAVNAPTLTVDSVSPVSSTISNSDGSSSTTTTTTTPIVNGDTVSATQTVTTTNKNPSGGVISTSTITSGVSVDTASGSPLATYSPAIQAQAQSIDYGQIAARILSDSPAVMPTMPPITPDTDLYKPFLETVNPFKFNPADYLPKLPESSCSYEVHVIIFGRPLNLAPCDKLQPLRTVLGWVFAVLTGWSCFLVIFRSEM